MNNRFDQFPDRRNSDSIKWNRYEEDVLPLWVADMDYFSPDPVIDCLHERIDHGLFGYSLPQESTKEAIKSWLKRRFDWNISLDDIILFPGVVPAFNIAAQACTNPGDSVLIQTPAYRPFLDLPKNTQLLPSEHMLSTNQDGSYYIDLDEFSKCILPNTRIFMLCNPHNPTGRVFRNEELVSIANLCLENDLIICSDEIHSDIVFPPHKHIPIASMSEEISNSTITLISPSKTFNLAGLYSSAVIITNPRIRDQFINQARGVASAVNLLGEVALYAAYTFCDDWLDDFLLYLEQNRRLLIDFFDKELPDVSISKPEGTYLGWLDFSKINLDDPAKYILDNARVALNPGSWFGCSYQNYARINFACQFRTLETALDRIKSTLLST